MNDETFICGGRAVRTIGTTAPRAIFLQPTEERELRGINAEAALLREGCDSILLAAFAVGNWNADLSPWPAPPVFGKVPFGGEAENTLRFLLNELLPTLRARGAIPQGAPLFLGGYSLAGLFALWTATKTDVFAGIAAASPSVWFPGWIEYVKREPIRCGMVYLSLGDREGQAKNPTLAAVDACIRAQRELLPETCEATLRWNPGNHFRDPEKRTADAFLWLAEKNDDRRKERSSL